MTPRARVLGAAWCTKCGDARHAKLAEIRRGADGHLLLVGRGVTDLRDMDGRLKKREWFVVLKSVGESPGRVVDDDHEVDLDVSGTWLLCLQHGPEYMTKERVAEALRRPGVRAGKARITINA